MKSILLETKPVIFLGVSDYLDVHEPPFPIGPIDIYRLNHHKAHIVYPGKIKGNTWFFLVSLEFINKIGIKELQINISDSDGNIMFNWEVTDAQMQKVICKIPINSNKTNDVEKINFPSKIIHHSELGIIIPKDSEYGLLSFNVDSMVNHPGAYSIVVHYNDISEKIGEIHFHYKESPQLTADQIQAINSDPNSVKIIVMTFKCKICKDSFKVYTGLKQDSNIEEDGCIWYKDLSDEYQCSCGKSKYSLNFLRESMHGLLLKDLTMKASSLNYKRKYSHEQIQKIANSFNRLIRKEKLEPPIQKFLQENPLLLSRFSAKRLFFKPDILGKYQADFGIVNSENELILIEIERPSIKLFKKDKHPTADLMHAFNQVNDWLAEYSKHPQAVLELLNLHRENIVAVRGAVIAGIKDSVKFDTLHRFLLNPPFRNILFLTLDDLSSSLIQISKDLI